jgi:hypothetical protein
MVVRFDLENTPMKVMDLRDGAPGGWIAAGAFRVDKEGSVWVDLDADVRLDADPDADLLQIRRNQELFADESGLKLGSKRLIEVPAEDLAGRKFDLLATPSPEKWGRVTLWQPWSYSWTLRTLPAIK